ncbi:MAG: hypothetical protein GY856_08515, partial [bacterium]|nr:hypothetical protein [bacterium]
ASPQVLDLPTDRPRPPVQSFRGRTEPVQLAPELTRALQELARRQGATVFMTLAAAFQVLLSRYAGQEEFLLGTPIANRNHAEIEELIGLFVNTLVMRCDLTGDPSFEELLARVRRAALAAYGHQDLPFERLVDELQPERNMSISPLFQVMFVLQNAPSDSLRMSGLHIEPLAPETTTAKF